MPAGGAERWLSAGDGVRLRVVAWRPDAAGLAACRGSVFLFGGRTEFAEKYFETIGDLLGRGFAVATADWRGQGLSDRLLDDRHKGDRRKGHVDDFASFDRDLGAFMSDIAPAFPKPWIGLAHSMGGQILLRGAHDHPEWFAGLVLSAPMLGLRFASPTVERLTRALVTYGTLAGLGSRYVPGGTAKAADEVAFADTVLTHDERRYAIFQALIRAEPKLGLGAVTFGWLAAAFRSMAMTSGPAYLAGIETPTLIVGAAEDALVDRAALQRAAAGMPNADLVIVDGARHEILIERDEARAQLWAAFDGFAARLAPPAASRDA